MWAVDSPVIDLLPIQNHGSNVARQSATCSPHLASIRSHTVWTNRLRRFQRWIYCPSWQPGNDICWSWRYLEIGQHEGVRIGTTLNLFWKCFVISIPAKTDYQRRQSKSQPFPNFRHHPSKPFLTVTNSRLPSLGALAAWHGVTAIAAFGRTLGEQSSPRGDMLSHQRLSKSEKGGVMQAGTERKIMHRLILQGFCFPNGNRLFMVDSYDFPLNSKVNANN